MKIISCLFYILLFLSKINAQETKWGLNISPAFLPMPNKNIGVQIGATYKLNNQLNLLTEIAFPIASIKTNENLYSNFFYGRLKSEIRYLTSSNSKHVKYYIGAQCTEGIRKYTIYQNSFYFWNKDSAVNFTKASLKSVILTLSIQNGLIFKLSKIFDLDWFGGIGIRYVNNKYINIQNPVGFNFRPKDNIFIIDDKLSGSKTLFHLNTGLRLIYWFNKHKKVYSLLN